MSYIALYREWRPLVFEDVVEQEHIVKTLRYSVSTGRIAHAYLFCGTRGTGKTTMAHIMSRAINCLNPNKGDPCNECDICKEILSGSSTDVLEIDAASNNSVDNVREIRDEVIYAPTRAKYKVYIIDEVHMLSAGAFNALLKTLEEPPSHVVFILATTEPHKLPVTVLSRCQRFDFRRITVESMVHRLKKITTANNIEINDDAAGLIARLSDGALRDAISLLDQCISQGSPQILYKDVLSVAGIVNDTFISELVDCFAAGSIEGILQKVDMLVADGKDIAHFTSDLIYYFRNLLICKITDHSEEAADISKETAEIMKGQSKDLSRDRIIHIIKELSLMESGLKWASNPRVILEVSLIKLCADNSIPASDNDSAPARSGATARSVPSSTSPAKPLSAAESESTSVQASQPAPVINYLESWQTILNNLKTSGKMTIHSFLIDTKAVSFDDSIIGIVFNAKNQFGRTIMSKPENIEAVEAAIKKVMGRDMKIQCVDENHLNSSIKPVPIEKDELVEKARSIAERAGVPFEIIDE